MKKKLNWNLNVVCPQGIPPNDEFILLQKNKNPNLLTPDFKSMKKKPQLLVSDLRWELLPAS